VSTDRVKARRNARLQCAGRVGSVFQEVLRHPDAEIGITGDLQCTPAGALRKAAPGVGLDAPGDAAEQELFVVGSGLFTEDFPVLLFEPRGTQVAQTLDLLADFGLSLHGVN